MENKESIWNLLSVVYEELEYTESSLVYIFGNKDGNELKYGIITKYGEILFNSIFNKESLKVFFLNKHTILEVHDKNDINIFILHDKGNSIAVKQIYSSSKYAINRLLDECIILYNTKGYGGKIVINYKGEQDSNIEYLSVIEHKNARELIGVRFLKIDLKLGTSSKRFDILNPRGKVKIKSIAWTEGMADKYKVNYDLLHGRNIKTIEYKTDEKDNKIRIYVNGSIDMFQTMQINRKKVIAGDSLSR